MITQEQFSKERPLSVVVVTQQIGDVISGIGLRAYNLVEGLVGDGHQVYVIAPKNQRPPGNLPYHFVGVPPPIAGNTQARWISLSISFARELGRLQYKHSFDLVHFIEGREALCYRANVPMIGNINDTYAAAVETLSFYRHYFDDWLLRWGYYHFVHACEQVTLRRLQAVIANSRYTMQVIADVYRIGQQLYMCYPGIVTKRYMTALKLRDQINPHPLRVLFVGGNMQRKGLPILINAAPRVLKSFPNVEFWIVGRDRAEPYMQSLCRRTGVLDRFRFFGWQSQDDLLKLYAQTDIFVMPSLTEAFGMVFVEAMASGLPVIGTRVGGIPEIIEHGYNGLLVERGNAAELGEALVLLLGDQNLRRNLRQAGVETAQRFDTSKMMQCIYQVYRTVLANQ